MWKSLRICLVKDSARQFSSVWKKLGFLFEAVLSRMGTHRRDQHAAPRPGLLGLVSPAGPTASGRFQVSFYCSSPCAHHRELPELLSYADLHFAIVREIKRQR